jgi:2,3-bisphosphoglycerate-independent phosphoglycerate mutase
MKKTFLLVVLDGWGIGAKDESNPIYQANLKTVSFLEKNFPAGAIQASGRAVGLPYYEAGNSEVGHLTLGSGRIIGGHLPRINSAIENGSFFKNENFLALFDWIYKNKSYLHLIGLLSEGEVHSSFNHLVAILNYLKEKNIDNYFLHLISDGRDSSPHSFLNLLNKLSSEVGFNVLSKLASVCGRYYAMDRDKHWDRTEKAYKTLIGEAPTVSNLDEMVKKVYDRGLNDEYLECVILEGKRCVMENDALFFFNFREDRMRQLSSCFLDKNFNYFPVKNFKNILVVTMTHYNRDIPSRAIFEYIPISNTLGEVLSKNKKTQLRIAETEKYAHVTYFFNGLNENPFPGEFRILVPSKNIFRYNEYPQMMARQITDRVLAALMEGNYDFILVNYANPDMVAHTGDFQATKKAVEIVDEELGRLVKVVLELDGVCIITSDHGNAEVLLDNFGNVETKHDPNPVPIYLVGKKFEVKKKENTINLPVIGMLTDVAPTILNLMGIEEPQEMTGQSLLPELLSGF